MRLLLTLAVVFIKADSGDYITLKLLTEYIRYPFESDIAALQWFGRASSLRLTPSPG